MNGDGHRSSADLLAILPIYENTESMCTPECSNFDMANENLLVAVDDFLVFLVIYDVHKKSAQRRSSYRL